MLNLPQNTSGYWDAGVFTGQERPVTLWPDGSGFFEDLEVSTRAETDERPVYKPAGLAGGPAVQMKGRYPFAGRRRLWTRSENHTFMVLQMGGGEDATIPKLLRVGSASGEGTMLQVRKGRLEIAASTKWNREHFRVQGRRMIADDKPHLIHWWDGPDGTQTVMVDGEIDIAQSSDLEVQPYYDGTDGIWLWDRGQSRLATPGLLGMVLTLGGSATDEELQDVYGWVGDRWPGVAGLGSNPVWPWLIVAAIAAGGGYFYYRKQQATKGDKQGAMKR